MEIPSVRELNFWNLLLIGYGLNPSAGWEIGVSKSVFRVFSGGVDVAGDVSEDTRPIDPMGSPVKTAIAAHSSAFWISKYALKLCEDQPAVRTISESVDPECGIPLVAPRRKQWGE